jgi:hypothetical protein
LRSLCINGNEVVDGAGYLSSAHESRNIFLSCTLDGVHCFITFFCFNLFNLRET